LGGTSPHVELIKKLKDRGYYTILVDYLDNSPGIKYADRHIKESTLDKEKVLEIAREESANLVISTCIDQANSVCCYVAEKLNLPHPYSYEVSLDVTDKGRMKKIMKAAGIPTSDYQVVTSADEINWDLIEYPSVVKPVDCNSSKGVKRVDNADEVLSNVKTDLEYSRSHQAIIEGFVAGDEVQVDCFATKNAATVLMTRQKKKISGDKDIVLQSTGSIIPARLDESLQKQAAEIANKFAKAFKLENTPFFYQAIITDTGISVLEFAPRIGGGLSYYLLKEIAGVDPIDYAINSFIGVESNVVTKSSNKCYSSNLLYMKPGVFNRIEGFDELEKEGAIHKSFIMKTPGTVIDSDMRSGNRVGAFVVEADTHEEVRKLEKKVYDNIKVLNDKNEDMLIRDI